MEGYIFLRFYEEKKTLFKLGMASKLDSISLIEQCIPISFLTAPAHCPKHIVKTDDAMFGKECVPHTVSGLKKTSDKLLI